MVTLRVLLFYVCVLAPTYAACQQQQPVPYKASPEEMKHVREQEQQIKDSIEQSEKHPEPKFGALQCRADAQKWTIDLSDIKEATPTIMVNGQVRAMPHLTPHVTASGLLARAYEMGACSHEDADFEKQYSTYSTMSESYREERCFRFMLFLTTHHLDEQFVKEDAEDNK